MYKQNKITTIDTYNRTAEKMAAKFNLSGARRYDIDRVLKYIHIQNPKIVELGCGNGRDAAVLLESTTDYLGMDASVELINIAKEANPGAQFQVSDFETFKFPENIDAIFALASLIHADKPLFKEVLDKAYNALSHNGLFFISLKHNSYQEHTRDDEFGTRTYYYYSVPDIIELIGTQYSIIEKELSNKNGQKWLEILLQKQT